MLENLTYVVSGNNNVYKNQALEEWLLTEVAKDEGILYLWQNEKTVVIGRNQNSRGECNINALNKDGGHLARRLSGGGAVYHDMGNINFTFVMPKGEYNLEKQLDVILCAVKSLGIKAQKSGRNDILADGRKFSGNAFYKTANAAYHHGTIMIASDMSALSGYLTVQNEKLVSNGVKSVRSRVVNLAELSADISVPIMQKALIEAFGNIYGIKAKPLSSARINEAAVNALYQKFSASEWILGREAPFDYKCQKRFSWGMADLRLCIENGIIKSAVLYTDALDEGLANAISTELTDMPLTRSAIQKINAGHREDNGCAQKDIITCFEELIINE